MADFTWRGDAFLAHVKDHIEKRLKTAAEVVKSEVVRSMNVSGRSAQAAAKHGTGPIRSRERMRVGKKKSVYIFRSRPGEVPHVQTAQLKRSIFWEYQPSGPGGVPSAIIGTPLKYGLYLERGTRRMAPRPYLRPALLRSTSAIQGIFSAPLPDLR